MYRNISSFHTLIEQECQFIYTHSFIFGYRVQQTDLGRCELKRKPKKSYVVFDNKKSLLHSLREKFKSLAVAFKAETADGLFSNERHV